MAVIFLYFALFLGVHFLSKQFLDKPSGRAECKRPGAARLFQLIACFILLFGFFGFRDITILNDTPHYYGSYYQLTKIRGYVESSVFVYRLLTGFEYGYQVVQHILMKYVSKEPYTIILFSSLVITCGNIYFWNKRTKNIALAILMVLLSSTLIEQYSLIRQAFALMFFYKAYDFLKREEWKPYTLIIICAAFFHLSVLVLLVLPILQKLKINRRNVILILGSAFVISLTVYQLFSLLGQSENIYFIMNKKREAFPLGAVLDGLLMLAIILSCAYMNKKDGIKEINRTDFWLCLSGLGVCIITPAFLSFFRINVYLWPFIYAIFFKKAEKHPQLLTALLIVLTVKIAVILAFRNEYYHLIPYSFYDWSDKFHYFNLYWKQ